MSLPNKHQTSKSFSNSVNDYYPVELGSMSGMFSQDWLYADLDNSQIESLPLYTPSVNIAEKPLDIFGGQVWNPFETGTAVPLPTTVSAADLNLNATPIPSLGNVTSQPSRTTSSSDDSLLLGGGGTDKSESLTTPEDSEAASKPTYKPGWSTASSTRESESISSSTPRSKKRAKISLPEVKPRRTSPRNLSLSSNRHFNEIKEENDEFLPPESAEPTASKSKRSHNLTEKKYRTRLNGYFETLLSVIPRPSTAGDCAGVAGDAPEKKISKGEVLVLAMEYIKELERDQSELEEQRKALSSDMEHLKDASSGVDTETAVY